MAVIDYMKNPEQLNILLFCNMPVSNSNANTIIDHINAFSTYSKHNIITFSCCGYFPPNLSLDTFDVIIIHYSTYLLHPIYLSPEYKNKISAFKGLKVLFLQDEYRHINAIHEQIKNLGINILFTCVPEQEIEKVYPASKLPALIKINNLTGYVPPALLTLNSPEISERSVDVGYRSRKLPFWYGKLSLEKTKIVDDFLLHNEKYQLKCDLSYQENKRIYGNDWLHFIQSCKTMLGVESGASVFDFTGEIENKIEKYQALNPNATFEDVHEKFLKAHEGLIYLNQISPRCFEAIALKSVLVLFEGKYSDVLIPDRHYIPLKKDFSNIESVVNKIRDNDYLQKIADCAYHEIALNPAYSYQYFINFFDETIFKEFTRRKLPFSKTYITQKKFEDELSKISMKEIFKKRMIKFSYYMAPKIPTPVKFLIKPLCVKLINHISIL